MKDKLNISWNKVWQIIKTLLILFGFFLVSQISMTLIPVVGSLSKGKSSIIAIGLGVLWLIIFYLTIRWIWRYYKRHSGDIDIKITKQDVGTAFAFFLVGRVIAVVGTSLMTMIYGTDTSANDQMIQELFGVDSQLVVVLLLTVSIAIGAPIMEELVFRGLPTRLLLKDTPKWFPMIMTSLAFSSVHQSDNIVSFMMYFSLGLIMYVAYQRKGRIVDSMLLHFFNNLLPAVFLLASFLMNK
ncbi:MAG: lysostaphin resistance A-like protein [Vagococcus sp.]